MAHKKGGGSSRNGRDSHSKRLGVKAFGGQVVLFMRVIDQVEQHDRVQLLIPIVIGAYAKVILKAGGALA